MTPIEKVAQLEKENERLKKIILREISHDDELGAEYTYVLTLRDEIKRVWKIHDDFLNGPYFETQKREQLLRDEVNGAVHIIEDFLITFKFQMPANFLHDGKSYEPRMIMAQAEKWLKVR